MEHTNPFLINLKTNVNSSSMSRGSSGGVVHVTDLVETSNSREPEKASVDALAEDITFKYSPNEIQNLISLLRQYQRR
jgi:hypothetical protein